MPSVNSQGIIVVSPQLINIIRGQQSAAIPHAGALREDDFAMVQSYRQTVCVADVRVPQPMGFPAIAFGFLA